MSRTTSSSSTRRSVTGSVPDAALARAPPPPSPRAARREQQAEDGAPPGRAVDAQRAAVPAHDAENGGEAEAAAGELRREERLEDAIDGARVHARAVVAHLEGDVAAGRERLPARLPQRSVAGADVARAGGDRDRPPLSPIASAALMTRFISTCWIWPTSASTGGSSGSSRASSRTLFGSATSRRGRFSRTSALKSVGRTTKWPAARVGEHLPREVGRALDGGGRLLDVPPRRRCRPAAA